MFFVMLKFEFNEKVKYNLNYRELITQNMESHINDILIFTKKKLK